MEQHRVAENAAKYALDSIRKNVLDILDADDGRSFEEKKRVILAYLKEAEDASLGKAPPACAVSDPDGCSIKRAFWSFGETIQVNRDTILRPVDAADRAGFLRLKKEYSVIASSLAENETCCELLWKEHNEDKTLSLSIVRGGTYVGYCGIKDLRQKPWEIAIELLPEWTRRGIGRTALTAMLDTIRERTGEAVFRVRIEPTNTASQKLFERLGAIPNGISPLWLHDPQELDRCEEENLRQIDDTLMTVAKKFGVEPRRLLSHVLEYRLPWSREKD